MLSITVLHYNNEELTKGCLESVEGQVIPFKHEKVLIDNGSDTVHPQREGWRVVRIENNRGNIGGQNACFEEAKGDTVLFVSNDVVFINPDCINMLREGYLIVYGQLMPMVYEERGKAKLLNFRWPGYGSEKYGYAIPSIVYIMSKKVWWDVGEFDEKFISSHEDIDMGKRLEDLGYGTTVYSDAKCFHYANSTLGKMPYYNNKLFHTARLRMIEKHYSGLDRFIRTLLVNIIDLAVKPCFDVIFKSVKVIR